ncbi:hypothetical protein P775_21305 [Puniceibacterium antarcticum]|uniref:Fe2OG dioxygenase domain-containing protein n=1 Tax=Puniceibacterium antarcticum TaxID=1206336 RepID=A0A2G8R975_9RHOB|nr:2OG-Fe(II) oxygenase [Puniceibacterium antarcticum]PIL18110.1 hypothetical protein P775_21305 [Puniceibacterium antarcticum]
MIAVHSREAAFSEVECDQIVALARASESSDARLVGQQRDHNLRRADLVWVDELPGTAWIMDRIIEVVRDANRGLFQFDLSDFAESPQIARYGAEREGHFDWHADIGDGVVAARRKLTMVVQLSSEKGYEGGALEIMPSANVVSAGRVRGTATLFPAFQLHRVTPVTKGERHSLTVWAHGPGFR